MENRNLASKYAKQVDERFTRESQAMLALRNDYAFTGVRTRSGEKRKSERYE